MDPEQNILWFNHQTYQQLQSWVAAELEKAILKAYFNKTSLNHENLDRIQRLKSTQKVTKYDRKDSKKETEEVRKLLEMAVDEAKTKSNEDVQLYKLKIKNF